MQAHVLEVSSSPLTREYQIFFLCNEEEEKWFLKTFEIVPSGPVTVILQSPDGISRLHIRSGKVILNCFQWLWNRIDGLSVGRSLVIDLEYNVEWSSLQEEVFDINKVTW